MFNKAGSFNTATSNPMPVAKVKFVPAVRQGSLFTLDASDSLHVDTYEWEQVAGSLSLDITDPNSAVTTQELGIVSKKVFISFRLTVTNEEGSDTATVNFFVLPLRDASERKSLSATTKREKVIDVQITM